MAHPIDGQGARWFTVSMFLTGLLIGGGSAGLRGDLLGRAAAAEVEQRLRERVGVLESDYKTISSQLARIEGMLRTRSQER